MSVHDDGAQALELISAIRPLLKGKSPDVQGAALADLLAMFLAGHVVRGDPRQTKKMREAMLKQHLIAVRALIDLNYKMCVEPQLKANTQ